MVLKDNNIKNIDNSNIFEEFDNNPWLKDEIKEIIKSQKKDIYYYFNITWHYIQVIFWLLLVILPLFYTYIEIQKNEEFLNNNLIDPLCFIFLWNIENTSDYCSSISSLNKEYKSRLENLKSAQLVDVNSLIESLYKIENLNYSKDIIFLREKSETKLPVLKILEEFDDLKNNFESIEKNKIKCFDISIDNKYIFQANCEAYSTEFDRQIKWIDWTDSYISWKAITYANSFINYIETQPSNFMHIDKQKVFSKNSIFWEKTWFHFVTKFKLELKYNSDNLF